MNRYLNLTLPDTIPFSSKLFFLTVVKITVINATILLQFITTNAKIECSTLEAAIVLLLYIMKCNLCKV